MSNFKHLSHVWLREITQSNSLEWPFLTTGIYNCKLWRQADSCEYILNDFVRQQWYENFTEIF